jgi:hypothetical protein
MPYYSKLKTNKSIIGLLPAIAALSIFMITIIFWGLIIGFKVLAVVILIYAAFQYYAFSRVRSLSYFVSATYILSFSLFLFFMPVSEKSFARGEFSPVAKFFTFTTIFLLVWLIYLLLTRKTKWKGREVFELAAMSVTDTSDGFTERPRPAGKMTFSKHDLMAYAAFLRKNHIALPFAEEDKIVLVPVMMGDEFALLYGFRPNYLGRSWVAITFHGHVTVHISKDDYLKYRDRLSFDQLCESMGDLFKEFLEIFLNNEEVRIVDRLDALKVSVFS